MTTRAFQAPIIACLLILGATLTQAATLEVGFTVPDLTLSTLGDADRTLSDRDGPTVLVFFRGVW